MPKPHGWYLGWKHVQHAQAGGVTDGRWLVAVLSQVREEGAVVLPTRPRWALLSCLSGTERGDPLQPPAQWGSLLGCIVLLRPGVFSPWGLYPTKAGHVHVVASMIPCFSTTGFVWRPLTGREMGSV